MSEPSPQHMDRPARNAGASKAFWRERYSASDVLGADTKANWLGEEHLDTSWMQRGHCARKDNSADLAVFFPNTGSGVIKAKERCEGCPVAEQCLNYALEHHIDYGVWGGASERQRRRIHSERRQARGGSRARASKLVRAA